MYDTSQGIELVSAELLDSSVATIKLARKPYLAIFQVKVFFMLLACKRKTVKISNSIIMSRTDFHKFLVLNLLNSLEIQ